MKNKQQIRQEIDKVDDKIIDLLNYRYDLSKEIGIIKSKNLEQIKDNNRELQIIAKIRKYENSDLIEDIYNHIFNQSKTIQKAKYYLVGKNLNYSYSKLIHNMLGNHEYEYYETDNFENVNDLPFIAINVTNPYKHEAYKICDKLSEIASKTKTVNTIIRYNGSNYGFNTDYVGFVAMIKHQSINLKNKTVGILGNGNTKSTVALALSQFGVKEYKVFARNPKENEESLKRIYNYNPDIIINTTSYNVFPNIELEPIINMDELTHTRTIIDVNYNPTRSVLGLTENIKYYNGLYMLIAQAEETESLIDFFYKRNRNTDTYQHIIEKILSIQKNIVLVGMPYAGKTTLAKKLGSILNRPYYDTDEILSNKKQSLQDVLASGQNEETFRTYESDLIKSLSTYTGAIIALGGGAINNSNNMTFLSQNGIIIYLDTPLEILTSRLDNTRPLIKNKNDLEYLYNIRKDKYQKYADVIIRHRDVEETIKAIKEYLNYENSNY